VSPDNAFLQTATLEVPDAECADVLLLHADGAVFLGRRLAFVDAAADAPSSSNSSSSSSSIKTNSSSDVKKLRTACDLIPTASVDQVFVIFFLNTFASRL
jgi:hypothetical protein